jgi:hypothetical protein
MFYNNGISTSNTKWLTKDEENCRGPRINPRKGSNVSIRSKKDTKLTLFWII